MFTTAGVPAGQSRDYWHHAVTKTFGPLDLKVDPGRVHGTIVNRRVSFLRVSTAQHGPQALDRTRQLISSDDHDLFGVAVLESGRLGWSTSEANHVIEPGRLFFVDTRERITSRSLTDVKLHAFQIPKSALGLPPSDVRRMAQLTVDAREGVAGLLAPLLRSLVQVPLPAESATRERLAGNVVDLLATLVTDRLGSGPHDQDLAHRAMALRIKAFIDLHLTDPRLSPETIAGAHHISTRYLHQIFQGEEMTVRRFIQRRRLEECRRELGRRGTRAAVSAVAHRWGFASAAHFSRAFRDAFGVSPSTWRAMQAVGVEGR